MSDYISIEQALQELRDGRMLILEDDKNREHEGDLIFAAEHATGDKINFLIRYCRGLVCMPTAAHILDRLQIPPMCKVNRAKYKTPFAISIGAADGMGTGISPIDRAATIKAVIANDAKPEDIVSPGHVFPLRAEEGGTLIRGGHTDGVVDLMKLAGLKPAGVLCEIINDDGTMARGESLAKFAKTYDIHRVAIEDIIAYRIKHETLVDHTATAKLPLADHGEFKVHVFKSRIDGVEHLALVHGEVDIEKPVLVRLHSECLTGETFGSSRCDCGWQLATALEKIAKDNGILIYARQEGRGIGLANKIRAYALQDEGLDTVEANHKLGFPADQRDYGIAAQMLRELNVNDVRLMTNNPRKMSELSRYGINVVGRESIEIEPNDDNLMYLKTKRDKMGHLLTFKEVTA